MSDSLRSEDGFDLFVISLFPRSYNPRSLKESPLPYDQNYEMAPIVNYRRMAKTTMLIFALWLPWVVSLYPGAMLWDTYYQIWQCYPEGHPIYLIPWAPTESFVDNYFSDHHPIFDTLIFGAFARASDALFGTWNPGVFAFILLQALGTAASFAAAVEYLRRQGCPRPLRIGCTLFFALVPFYPLYTAAMIKDSLFSWLYVPWFLIVVEIARTQGACLAKNRIAVWFVVLSLLLCLTKKTGVYVVLFTVVVLAIAVAWSYWRRCSKRTSATASAVLFRHTILFRLVACGVASLVLMQIILPYLVFPVLDVVPGGKQEALGPLFQQTARYVSEHGDDVTSDERAAIDKVLGYDDLAERYVPEWADPVKFEFNTESTANDLGNYLKTWVKQGLRHPGSYLRATWATAGPYFFPSDPIVIRRDTGDVEHDGSPLVWQPVALDDYRTFMLGLYDTLASAPIIGVVFQMCLYTFYAPLVGFVVGLKRHSRITASYGAVVISLVTCIVTPMTHARYALPLIYTAPLLLCFLFCPKLYRVRQGRQR